MSFLPIFIPASGIFLCQLAFICELTSYFPMKNVYVKWETGQYAEYNPNHICGFEYCTLGLIFLWKCHLVLPPGFIQVDTSSARQMAHSSVQLVNYIFINLFRRLSRPHMQSDSNKRFSDKSFPTYIFQVLLT